MLGMLVQNSKLDLNIVNLTFEFQSWNIILTFLLCSSLGTNIKKPNFELLELWRIELRTPRTCTRDFETELRTCKTEHRTFIKPSQL